MDRFAKVDDIKPIRVSSNDWLYPHGDLKINFLRAASPFSSSGDICEGIVLHYRNEGVALREFKNQIDEENYASKL